MKNVKREEVKSNVKKQKKSEVKSSVLNWQDEINYNRNVLKDKYMAGKIVKKVDFMTIGRKMGLKDITLELKLKRWNKEKTLQRTKDGNFNFA